MLIPQARGTLSERVFPQLTGGLEDTASAGLGRGGDADSRDDAAVTLWALQELHYRGFDDVDDALEWHPAVHALRWELEADLEARLRERHADLVPRPEDHTAEGLAERLFAMVEADDGPSLARHVETTATRDEVEELLRHRSVYHLKEADPTTWVVPRLEATVKAALMEVQLDEYGGGDPARLHHHLFARGLAASGMSADYGATLDEASAAVLEQNAALSMLGLHRRLRGAALGHLAAVEASSSGPSRRMARGLQRLGFAPEMVEYYTEHVEADAVHEQLAVRAICGALVEREPHLAGDVLLGAAICLDLEARTATDLLARWDRAA
ncbi:iron-containing redox enzyme family protein [Nocardioides kribbensis]|uniref:iron-containing redox enzyme family protein n=1 Tax=Nocardioides kribbensis TaxID=305517 RepID=UPI0018793449|nr:iron-containing redox enzyme family protein [Nocardioides kribbensis]